MRRRAPAMPAERRAQPVGAHQRGQARRRRAERETQPDFGPPLGHRECDRAGQPDRWSAAARSLRTAPSGPSRNALPPTRVPPAASWSRPKRPAPSDRRWPLPRESREQRDRVVARRPHREWHRRERGIRTLRIRHDHRGKRPLVERVPLHVVHDAHHRHPRPGRAEGLSGNNCALAADAPASRRCSSVTCAWHAPSSRLAIRAPRHPESCTYFRTGPHRSQPQRFRSRRGRARSPPRMPC